MPAEKVSLSLDADLVAAARRVAGHRGLSALVNDALRIKLQHERLRALLADMEAEFGPVPAAEMDRARAAWPDRGIGKRKSRRSA
jgi:Arc/MetJ family transcription regulator